MKTIPFGISCALLLGGCSVAQPDFTPIGDGLKAIGISFVVYGVLKSLVKLVRADDRRSKKSASPKAREADESKPSEGGTP